MSAMGESASEFGWFTTWVHQHLALGLTFARGISPEQLLAGLGLGSGERALETFEEAQYRSPWGSPPMIRVGECAAWAYAVEGSTQLGVRSLGRLSSMSGEAFGLVYTPTISTFEYHVAGENVSGFDLTVPGVRWGREPHRFDAAIEQAGFLRPHGADFPALSARLVQLIFGITIDRAMLD